MSQYIANLPTDFEPVSLEEQSILDSLFTRPLEKLNADSPPADGTTLHRFIEAFKVPLLIGLVFFILASNIMTSMIQTAVPHTHGSTLSVSIVKALSVSILTFIILNKMS